VPRLDWQRWWPGGWPPSENTVLLALAVAVGLTTGGGVWLFRQGIDFFQRYYREALTQEALSGLGQWAIIPVLALAGLAVGWLIDQSVGEDRHHGVAGIIEATALAGGRLRYRQMPIKAVLSAFSLGAGASIGPEDPSVQVGASLGSMFGQWLRLSDERVRLLVAAGAAGGIASAFRAPIAGVFFALEVILSDFSTGSFGVVVLAAVIASVFIQTIEPSGAELGMQNYTLGGLQEIPLYILLGLLAAPIAAIFIRVLYWQQDVWHRLTLARPVKTALAGAIIGVAAIYLPQIMGTGRDTMNALLQEHSAEFGMLLLLALAAAKMLATAISLGGGFIGGMFAPSLFVGAALGGAFGRLMSAALGGSLTANPAAFAMAGMAAMMTGVIRAPITAVLLPFELTHDYTLILPIMLITAVSLLLVERLAPDGIYQLGLARKGIRLSRGRDIDLMQTITVGEAMTTNPRCIPASAPASQLAAEFARTNSHGLLVADGDGLLFGVVTLQDLARASEARGTDKLTIGDICTRDVLAVTPDDTVSKALYVIGNRDLGRLPVVEAPHSRKIVGVLRRRDIARAYEMAVHHKMEGLHRAEQTRLATYSRAYVVELRVEPGSAADGQCLRDLSWPMGSVVASVWRRGQVIAARGDTALLAGDLLTVVTTQNQEPEIARLVALPAKSGKKSLA
jgi:CIC family chloride channel protein